MKPLLLTLLMAVAAMGQPMQDPHMPEIGQSHKGLIWESNQIAISLEFTNTITVGSNVYRVKNGMLEQVGPPAKWWSEIDEIKAPTAFHLDYVREDVSHGLTWEYASLTNEAAPNGDTTNLLVDFYHSRFRPVPIQWATNRHLIGEFNFGFTISNAIGEGTYSNEYAVLTWRGEKHTNWLDRTKINDEYWMTVADFASILWTSNNMTIHAVTTNKPNGKPAEPITTNWEYDGYRAELWKPHRAGLMFPEIIFDHLEVLQHSQREQGYTSDGRVVWRTPPEVGGEK